MQLNMFNSFEEFNKPLATRLRPRDLEEFYGQNHLIDEGKLLREMIETDNISSMIFWGPPGVGKTTLANIIARKSRARFLTLSAVTSGIKEIKELMSEAEELRKTGTKTIVFIDEIHRFNKAQQDAFLPYVEKGSIILIGATTENPSFEVNAALLSRSKVFVLEALKKSDIVGLLSRAIKDIRAFPDLEVDISKETLNQIATYANGDARTALNTLELAVNNSTKDGFKVTVSEDIIKELLDKNILLYDKTGEEHYNIISALHKSMRNSDPDGAVYWLYRMLDAGENPLYIARRIIRFASEDIGLADNSSLSLAISAYNACHYLGMPECDLALTQAVIHMALAPKSNSVYEARNLSREDIKNTINEPVPMHLRNASTGLMKELGYGKGYKYAHAYEEKIADMQTLPDSLIDKRYYYPSDKGDEKVYKERLEYIKKLYKDKD